MLEYDAIVYINSWSFWRINNAEVTRFDQNDYPDNSLISYFEVWTMGYRNMRFDINDADDILLYCYYI